MEDQFSAKIKTLFDAQNIKVKHLNPGYSSTNDVYEVSSDDGACIIKVAKSHSDAPNTFWQGLFSLFGLTQEISIQNQEAVVNFINQHGTILAPKIVKAEPISQNALEKPFVILEKMQGDSPSHDSKLEFQVMQDKQLAYQLGQHIGSLHKTKKNYFGCFETQKHALSEWPQKLHDTIKLLGKSRKALQNKEVQQVLPYYLIQALKVKAPTSTSLIMLDCWPSQFLASQNRLTACIDIEAYVVGPKALELTLIELWLSTLDPFKKGYFEVNPSWPEEIEENREVYRFFLFLLYGCPEKGLEACIYSNDKFPKGDKLTATMQAPKLKPPGYPGPIK